MPRHRSAATGWRSSARSPTRAASRSGSGRPPRASATWPTAGCFRSRRRRISTPRCRRWPSKAAPLEPLRLLGLADFLSSLDETRASIRRAAGSYVYLASLSEMAASFKTEVGDIREKIDAAGEVNDQASGELRSLRDRLRKQRARLRNTLESYLRGRDTARYLQDQIVTDRNGRYVLVVRPSTGRPFRASSTAVPPAAPASTSSRSARSRSTTTWWRSKSRRRPRSGASCLALTDAFRRRALDLQRTLEVATELDVLQAKARFSQLVGGIEPA